MSSIASAEPPRLKLAHLPTPLQSARWTFAGASRPLWFKRDDYSGAELSGNKVRKLEYLLADAQQQGATTLITCGGEQSNHARATAAAAARLGLRCHLVLRCADPVHPPAATGNIFITHLMGATIHWIAQSQWQHRNQIMATLADQLAVQGQQAYVIPVGGSNALGSWGYVRAMHELLADLEHHHIVNRLAATEPTTVVYACGSGGTAAGLIIGAKLLGLAARGVRVVGINVSDNQAYFVAEILNISGEFEHMYKCGAAITAQDIHIADGHVGAGYAKSQPAEIATIQALAKCDGIVLDPVYSGKAFHGLCAELTANPQWHGSATSPIVFIHTGGLLELSAPATWLIC